MQPSPWQPPVELSAQEEQIVNKIRKAKLFVFLRHHRRRVASLASTHVWNSTQARPLQGTGSLTLNCRRQ